jgi:hypothetical protein
VALRTLSTLASRWVSCCAACAVAVIWVRLSATSALTTSWMTLRSRAATWHGHVCVGYRSRQIAMTLRTLSIVTCRRMLLHTTSTTASRWMTLYIRVIACRRISIPSCPLRKWTTFLHATSTMASRRVILYIFTISGRIHVPKGHNRHIMMRQTYAYAIHPHRLR